MRAKPVIGRVRTVRDTAILGILAFSVALSSTLSTGAQMLPFSSRPDLINWVNGPAKADLGPTAEIDIPYGFSFAARNEAAALLQMMNNPVPDSLVGVLAPASRRYLIVFELNSVGYVKNAAHQNLDSKLILKYLRRTAENQNTNAPADDPNTIKWMEWKMKPKFDRDQNVVEWSILAETDSARTINHVVRLLGREGILDAIAVQSTESNETIPLRQLVAGISFNAGYTYADYHAGDKVAERNLAELIAGESSPELRTTSSNHLAYSLAGGALILLGAGVLAVRRKSRPTGRHSAHSVHAHAPLPARKPAVVHSTANGSAHSAIAPAKQPEKSAHNGNGKTSQPKLRRRRIFDYQRYYADLMSQVSDRAQETIAPAPARKVERTPAPVQRMDSHSIAAAAQAGLIESQKRLIEEQQRLIREQAKLIEEKTRVIQEKNQVLDKQTELFGNNIF
jgi:uncharacterized membrane-anchored protein